MVMKLFLRDHGHRPSILSDRPLNLTPLTRGSIVGP